MSAELGERRASELTWSAVLGGYDPVARAEHRYGKWLDEQAVDVLDLFAGWDEYFTGHHVFYSSVSGFKGLERTCVVLAVNGFSAEAQAKEMLYVGLSRARSQLVVVGDLGEIARVGGDGVRKRLEAAESWELS